MKNKKFILLIMLLFLPFVVRAEEMTYDEAKEALQQSIQAWYMRGYYRQYNSPKNTYALLRHPEDATVQDTGYAVCSGFTNDAWMEAFGFQGQNDNVVGGHPPAGSEAYTNEAKKYLDAKGCKTSKPDVAGCKGEFLVFYQKKDESIRYVYNPNGLETSEVLKVSNFVKLLQEGDMVAYNGHVAIVYGFKYDSKGKKTDALLFQSGTGGVKVYSKIDPTEYKLRQLFYYKAKKTENNGLLDINTAENPYEGTVKWAWFSSYSSFVKDGKIDCQKDKCSITRAYYKGSDGKAVFNYDVKWPQNIRASKARIEMPGIYITKTSSKYDNNSVTLGDTITYTITIINNSNLAKEKGESKAKKYSNFHVVETLPAEVEFVAGTVDNSPDGSYNETNRTVAWDIDSLAKGEKIVLKYKVKVKKEAKNIGKYIEANGKVYKSNVNNYVTTGTVRHEIINSTAATDAEYKNCYEKEKKDGYEGLALIQRTYICVYGEEKLDFNFRKLDSEGALPLTSFIVFSNEADGKAANQVRFNMSGERKVYADMILNNYWGGLEPFNKNGETIYHLVSWRNADTNSYLGDLSRAKTIASGHFKTGDVLVYYNSKSKTKEDLRYTKESGTYAFIYIDGSFVGINQSGKASERNIFTKKYYEDNKIDMAKNLYQGSTSLYEYANYQTLFGKDAYVIFRPEKVITDTSKIVIKTNPTKTTYYQNQTLDLSGGVITVTSTDGTTKDVAMTDSDVKVTGYNSTKVGEQTITVTYDGKSASFTVTVVAVEVTSISIKTNPNKLTYYVGDTLDVTGGVINVHYSDNSTKQFSMSNKNITFSGFSSTEAGSKTVTVTYSGKSASFNVQVNAVALSTIEIEKYPTKLTYVSGEDLDLTGGKIKKTYNNGTTQSVNMSDSTVTVTGYNKTQLGAQTITATVDGKHVTFEIYVNSSTEGEMVIDSISVYATPSKLSYRVGESLNLTGGKIQVKSIKTVGSNTEAVYEVIDMTSTGVTVSGFSSTEVGEKTLTVAYKQKTATFTVAVTQTEAKLSTIEVSKLPKKKQYIQYQENLNVEGGELTATYTDGTTKTVALTNEEVIILDFDNTQLGEQQIHVIYKGLEASFPVTIYSPTEPGDEEDENGPIQSVEIVHDPIKVNYVQFEDELDLSGVILRVVYDDGEVRDVDLGDYPGQYTVMGFDNHKAGEQTVTIDYHGFQVSFKVNVEGNTGAIEIPDTLSRNSIIVTIISFLLIGGGLYFFWISKNEPTNEQ